MILFFNGGSSIAGPVINAPRVIFLANRGVFAIRISNNNVYLEL